MNNLVVVNNGKAVASSRVVATYFNKEHKHVMEAVRKLINDEESTSPEFSTNLFMDKYNREQPEYLMTKKGFTLLAMGFTGKEALKFKIAYFEQFEAMEESLKEKLKPMSLKESLLMNIQLVEDKERIEAALKESEKIKQLAEAKIEEDKPKVIFAETVANSEDLIKVRDLSKILTQNGIKNMGERKLFAWLRNCNYLTMDNMPTQKSSSMGLFKVVQYAYTDNSQNIQLSFSTKITPKGQIFFVNKFMDLTKGMGK